MTVHKIESSEQFKEALENNKTVLVDWFAEWCGPCKAISPIVEQLSEQVESIYFVQVDIDAVPDLAEEHGIRAMPTFYIFQDGERVDDFTGANPPKLQELIAKYS